MRCRLLISLIITLVLSAMGGRKRFVQRIVTSLNSNTLDGNRFWTQTHQLPQRNGTISQNRDISDQLQIATESNAAFDLAQIDMGILFSTQTNVMVPIHGGKLQLQHTSMIPASLRGKNAADSDESDLLLLCAFAPRAGEVSAAPVAEERQLDIERRDAINIALEKISISWEELLTARLAGTPPARIYRSFCSPRVQAVHTLEPLERAADRAAAQLELAWRQLRADEASYLRNTDKAPINIPGSSDAPVARKSNPVVLVLDNIRSAFNVGSMFRTGETAGVSEIITCGITAHPPHPKLRKTALSATDSVPFRHFEDVMTAIATLKEEGHTIVAMETTSRSEVYTDIEYPLKVALVVGNEVTGVDTRVMESADFIAEIPTYGVKNSLNVASAAPIVVFEVLRQWSNRKLI